MIIMIMIMIGSSNPVATPWIILIAPGTKVTMIFVSSARHHPSHIIVVVHCRPSSLSFSSIIAVHIQLISPIKFFANPKEAKHLAHLRDFKGGLYCGLYTDRNGCPEAVVHHRCRPSLSLASI